MTLLWPAEAIWEAVVPVLPGFTVEVLQRIDSTNTEVMRRAKTGQLDPILLVAEQQTAGRGRLGRNWHSSDADPKSLPLMFSLGMVLSPASWSGLSLAVGVSVAQSLHPDLRLKWPNDVWLDNRKLGGILIETASFGDDRYVVIGVGINVGPRPAAGLSTPPAWLQEVQPDMDAASALQRILPALVHGIQQFEAKGFAPFQAGFNALDALAGRVINLSDGTTGQSRGVDASGALLVQAADGVRKITSSEVSVRPAMDEPELEPGRLILPC
jgi:BirA family biotin operon repressor/biotin-[acetyl-CoA-carboxylase] ligase